MFFETDNLIITTIEERDIKDILEIYNSNTEFLQKHIDKNIVTEEWLKIELEEIKKLSFNSYIIKEKSTNKTIGFLDIKIAEESYLSLIMLHNDYKNKGLGKIVYSKLEEYLKSINGKSIRIDIVIDYNKRIKKFWDIHGFKKVGDVELNWTGKHLPAIIMKKII